MPQALLPERAPDLPEKDPRRVKAVRNGTSGRENVQDLVWVRAKGPEEAELGVSELVVNPDAVDLAA